MWNRPKNSREGWGDRAFLVALVLLLIVTIHHATARASEVDIDPTAVIVQHSGTGTVGLLTNAPVVNGSRYVICMTTTDIFPVVNCLAPSKKTDTAFGQVYEGTWETSFVLQGGQGT